MKVDPTRLLPPLVITAAGNAGLAIGCTFEEEELKYVFDIALADDPEAHMSVLSWPNSVHGGEVDPKDWVMTLSGSTSTFIEAKHPYLAAAVGAFCKEVADGLGIDGLDVAEAEVVEMELPDYMSAALAQVNENSLAGQLSCSLTARGEDVTCAFSVPGDADALSAVLKMTPDMLDAPDNWPEFLAMARENLPAGSEKLSEKLEGLGALIYRNAAADLGLLEVEKTYLTCGRYSDNGRLALTIESDLETYGTLTVNLPDAGSLDPDIVFINSYISRDSLALLSDHLGLAAVGGVELASGFNTYQGYRLDLAKLMEACPCCWPQLPEALQDQVATCVMDVDLDEAEHVAQDRLERACAAAAMLSDERDAADRGARGGEER